MPLSTTNYTVQHACALPAPEHVGCLMLELVPRTPAARARTHPVGIVTPSAVAAGRAAEGAYGLRPQDLSDAYFPGEQPDAPESKPQTIALVDVYDDLDAEADLQAYDEEFNLPACTAANRCFEQVNEHGESSMLPFPSNEEAREATERSCIETGGTTCEELEHAAEWSGETSLDIETAHAICQNCRILLVEASAPEWPDIEAAEDTAVRLGATVVSNSLGGAEPPSDSEAFNHPGTVITASSGDFGYLNWRITKSEEARYGVKAGEVSYPASSPHVVAVGGTALRLAGPVPAWSDETVWSASSGGCSAHFAAAEWQRDVSDWTGVGCEGRRAVVDVSADADPGSGVAVYDSFPESFKVEGRRERVVTTRGWYTGAGTSLSSPIIAAMFALAGGAHGVEYPAQTLYTHLGSALLHDVFEGANGKCAGNYSSGCSGSMSPLSLTDCGQEVWICNATSGYDGPSGVGTPNGIAALRPTRAHTWSGGPETPITTECAGAGAGAGAGTSGAVWEGQMRACGTLDPKEEAKSGYYFAYNQGTSCLGGKETPLQPEVEGQDTEVEGELYGLQPDTQYTYCLIATDASGETAGSAVTFTTLAPSEPEAGPPTEETKRPTEQEEGTTTPTSPILSGQSPGQQPSGLSPSSPIFAPTLPVPAPTAAETCPDRSAQARHAFAVSGLSLSRGGRRDAVLLELTIACTGSSVRVEVAASWALKMDHRHRRMSRPTMLARLMRTDIKSGELRLAVPLSAGKIRALFRHRDLRLTVRIVVATPDGRRQTIARTIG